MLPLLQVIATPMKTAFLMALKAAGLSNVFLKLFPTAWVVSIRETCYQLDDSFPIHGNLIED